MPSAKRIICVGHAALDRIYRIEAFPPEPTKVRALEHVETGGGMAANAAVAIARLGGKAELWSRTGDDAAGNAIRAGLKAERVDVRYVQGFEGARSSTSAIIVDDQGERLIVGQRDAGMPSGTSWLPLERIKEADAVLGDVRWLEGLRAVFARARKEKVPTILDADLGAREALGGILKLTDYAIFSRAGAARVRARRHRCRAARARALAGAQARRRDAGRARAISGASADGGGHVPAFSVSVTDTTGAGDAFHGAFALMVAEGTADGGVRAHSHSRGGAQVHAARLSRRPADAQRARCLSVEQPVALSIERRGSALNGAIFELSTDFACRASITQL